MSSENKSALERHMQTFLTALVLGLCSWIAVSVLELRETSAVHTQKLSFLEKQYEEIVKSRVNRQLIDLRLRNLESDMESFQRRVARLEKNK